MLKFFKRRSSQQKHDFTDLIANSTETNDKALLNNSNTSERSMRQLLSLSYEGIFNSDIQPPYKKQSQSHLSKTLYEVLKDKNALLCYFRQFMESHNALCYLQCWLDIENFEENVNNSRILITYEHDNLLENAEQKTTNLNDNVDNDSNANTVDVNEITEEALAIFKKYIALEALENIHCNNEIRNEIVENICSNQQVLSVNCFKKAQSHAFDVMDKEYFEAFTHSNYFCKYQIDILTNGNVVLEDILYNETALFYFMEFLEQENNCYLLEFWLAATNFHQQLHDQKEFMDQIEAQNDAVILYDKYFSLQALCPLGFDDKVRFVVEQNICGEHGLIPDCFNLPLAIVEQALNKHYLQPFLASQLFFKYLSELINAVQSSDDYNYDRGGGRIQSSDCSSERSVCTNNTFLAMEVPKRNLTQKCNKATDMNIDTRELYDPDVLWRRKKHHRLSFGRVTELGQFVSDFEPQPDKKTNSRLRNVVKHFVNLEEDKKKEELAWQVAEIIVKGVTSVTLSEHEQKT